MNQDLEKKAVAGLGLTLLIIVLLGLYFVTEPWRQRTAREEFTRRASIIGAEQFLVTCAQCHGPRGEGGMGPALRDTGLDEEALIQLISRGRPGTPMPAFVTEEGGVFTLYQIRDIVDFIRHWNDSILEEVRLKLVAHGVLMPTPTPPPAAAPGPQGLQLYRQFGCGACHTIQGVSTSQVGPELSHIGSLAAGRQAGVPARDYLVGSLLKPGAFVAPGFAPIMPSYEGRLTLEELQALVDYMLGLDGAAATPTPSVTPPATPIPTTPAPLLPTPTPTAAPTPRATPTPSPTPTPTPAPAPAAAQGKQLFQQLGCGACHTVEGVSTSPVGPELTHISSLAAQRQAGVSVRDHLVESLLKPGAFVAPGFAPIMPSYEGRLTPEQLQALVDYLLSLK